MMNAVKQKLTLSGLRFYAYHGVEPQERIVGAWYTVGLEMEADVTDAMTTDSLDGTVNYARAARTIASVMDSPCCLLERVAASIAQKLMDEFPTVSKIRVCVEKENPPVCAPCRSASFSLTVSRE